MAKVVEKMSLLRSCQRALKTLSVKVPGGTYLSGSETQYAKLIEWDEVFRSFQSEDLCKSR